MNEPTATEARDAAIAAVERRPWIDDAEDGFKIIVDDLPDAFIGEDIRLALTAAGLQQPHHHNGWGGLIKRLMGRGYIVPTRDFINSKTMKSHARAARVYRKPHDEQI